MANVMSMKQVTNHVRRDGYDLSKRTARSAKIGELLPYYCREVVPGDKFDLSIKSFTRTVQVNSAAYTRIKEYYDWFFVPTNLLWNRFNNFIAQMKDNVQFAESINGIPTVDENHPHFTLQGVIDHLSALDSDTMGNDKNYFGFKRSDLTDKLMSYLGYGRPKYYLDNNLRPDEYTNVLLNPFPLLSYQKIYSDYFRDSQWEHSAPNTFNINYVGWQGAADMEIQIDGIDLRNESMFDLRYSNWHKDYFTGVLPNSQYGEAASVDLSTIIGDQAKAGQNGFTLFSNSRGNSAVSANNSASYSSLSYLQIGSSNQITSDSEGYRRLLANLGFTDESLSSAFTILALRKAEAAQKWKEITQSHQQDYKSQMKAHFGANLSDAYSDRSSYIGGFSNTLDIDEVLNTNLASEEDSANIRGKGVGASQGKEEFTVPVHGYIMCIYHAVPLLDYAFETGISKMCLKTKVTDYLIPEFDVTGMVSVPLIEMTNYNIDSGQSNAEVLVGYSPRYYDYKTDYDDIKGIFLHGGYDAWVAPITEGYIHQYFSELSYLGVKGVDYRFFKVNPALVNPIFISHAGDTVESDVLLNNVYFDVRAVRPLDRDGLPY